MSGPMQISPPKPPIQDRALSFYKTKAAGAKARPPVLRPGAIASDVVLGAYGACTANTICFLHMRSCVPDMRALKGLACCLRATLASLHASHCSGEALTSPACHACGCVSFFRACVWCIAYYVCWRSQRAAIIDQRACCCWSCLLVLFIGFVRDLCAIVSAFHMYIVPPRRYLS